MARNDKYYQCVKEALMKDGWTITHSPFTLIVSSKHKLKIDLGVEREILELETNKEKIVVEVKSFLDKSFFNDFHTCVGQYNNYMAGLQANKIARKLFLAIPHKVYLDHFNDPFIIDLVIRYNMSIITFDPTINRTVLWIRR